MTDDLLDLIRCCSEAATPAEAFKAVLQSALTVTSSTSAHLYLLNLVDGRFDCVASSGEDAAPHISFSETEALNPGQTADTLKSGRPVVTRASDHSASVLAAAASYPIKRNDQVLGALYLRDGEYTAHSLYLESISELSAMLYEQDWVFHLFKYISAPIYVGQDASLFYSALTLEARLASGTRFVAVRELSDDGKSLKCLAQDGFATATPLRDFDLAPLESHRHFQAAINNRKPVYVREVALDEGAESSLRGPHYSGIVSYIVLPLLVSDKVVGTISFATSAIYEFAPIEVSGLTAVANSVAVAISNYKNMLDKQAQQFKQLQLATLWNTVDVAQAVRHLVKKAADDNLRQILDAIAEGIESKASADELSQMFDDGYGQIDEIVRNMEHLKNITQPPDRSEGLVDLEKAWRDAYDLVRGRAQYGRDQEIKFNVHGGRASGIYKGELLKHAFINLILNSQDAFRLGPKNTERRIDVYVEDLGEAAGRVRMRYVDNAGGVSTGQLRYMRQPLETGMDIFTGGVTSKKEGSGWGLYLVRNFLQENGGSIRLADGRGGVTFELLLPRLGSREATRKHS